MDSLVSQSARAWRNKIGLTLLDQKNSKLSLFDLECERDRLKKIADLIVHEWGLSFPRSTVPVYLTKVSDKSLNILRWRLSKTHSAKAAQVSFGDGLLEYFHVDSQRKLVCKFESLRIDLNYKLSMVLYQIQRLENYISDKQQLVSVRKTLNTMNQGEVNL